MVFCFKWIIRQVRLCPTDFPWNLSKNCKKFSPPCTTPCTIASYTSTRETTAWSTTSWCSYRSSRTLLSPSPARSGANSTASRSPCSSCWERCFSRYCRCSPSTSRLRQRVGRQGAAAPANGAFAVVSRRLQKPHRQSGRLTPRLMEGASRTINCDDCDWVIAIGGIWGSNPRINYTSPDTFRGVGGGGGGVGRPIQPPSNKCPLVTTYSHIFAQILWTS